MSGVRQKQKNWKLIDLLTWTADYLVNKGFKNGRLETERLLAHALNLRRIDLYVNYDRPLTSEEIASFKQLLKRRLSNEPLQYILGESEFYSLSFKVNPEVLIPRPETEILVDEVLKICEQEFSTDQRIHLLDVGTGSGNIAVACAVNASHLEITAVDKSEPALKIARHNAEMNGVADKIIFLHLDAFEPWPEEFQNCFDVVVSNPPYVSTQEYQILDLEIRKFEPEEALVGGEMGLDFYDKFSLQLKKLSKPTSFAIFETGENQAEALTHLFKSREFEIIEVVQDLAKKNRILKIRRAK